MDIELLSKMLRELIPANETVSLPGVGEFVAVEMPASFSDKGYTINPPYRKLSFVQSASDDGLLVKLYSSSNGVSSEAARAIIREYTDKLSAALRELRTVVFPGLGRLRLTKSGAVLFIQDEDADIFPEGFGLRPLSLKYHCDIIPAEPFPFETPAAAAHEKDAATSEKTAVASEKDSATSEKAVEAPEEPIEVLEIVETASEEAPKEVQLDTDKPGHFRWWLAILIAVLAVLLFLAVFIVLAHVAPDFIDSILYTPEELRIINA